VSLGLHYLVANHGLGLLSRFRFEKIYIIGQSTRTRPRLVGPLVELRLWLVDWSIPIQKR